MISRLALVMMMAAPALPAQQSQAPTETAKPRMTGVSYIQRVYQVKHRDVGELFRLVYTTPSGQGQTPVIRSSQSLKAITVYGTSDEVRSIVANLEALDVPGAKGETGEPSFELTMYIVLASQREIPGAPLPDDLKAVADQLRQAFGYSQFRLLEANLYRSRAGSRGSWQGNATALRDGQEPASYAASFSSARVEEGVIRLDEFQFLLRPGGPEVRLQSNLDLKQGQKVVVGKANVGGEDRALILVLSARVAD